ncbi:hypothetical protein MJD09_19750 [bacterium]|nr:hypothetical protein [bacterium]
MLKFTGFASDKPLFDRIEELLRASKASQNFKTAVKEYLAGEDTSLIRHTNAPRIKVIRVLAKLLEEYRDEPISNVHISGVSDCSSFSGILTFGPTNSKVAFNWDCSWKAEQEGLQTWYGAPDQSKAVQIYGYQCFEKFEIVD